VVSDLVRVEASWQRGSFPVFQEGSLVSHLFTFVTIPNASHNRCHSAWEHTFVALAMISCSPTPTVLGGQSISEHNAIQEGT
jgi:hypothetical protein